MMTEKQIENHICCFLSECGLRPWKNETLGLYSPKFKKFKKLVGRWSAKGSPDIMFPMRQLGGRLVGIEVKKPGEPVPEHQLKFISRINEDGGIAFVSRSVEQTYDQLEKFWPEIQQFRHILRKYMAHAEEFKQAKTSMGTLQVPRGRGRRREELL